MDECELRDEVQSHGLNKVQNGYYITLLYNSCQLQLQCRTDHSVQLEPRFLTSQMQLHITTSPGASMKPCTHSSGHALSPLPPINMLLPL